MGGKKDDFCGCHERDWWHSLCVCRSVSRLVLCACASACHRSNGYIRFACTCVRCVASQQTLFAPLLWPCESPQVVTVNGLIEGHAYSVLRLVATSGHRLLQVVPLVLRSIPPLSLLFCCACLTCRYARPFLRSARRQHHPLLRWLCSLVVSFAIGAKPMGQDGVARRLVRQIAALDSRAQGTLPVAVGCGRVRVSRGVGGFFFVCLLLDWFFGCRSPHRS